MKKTGILVAIILIAKVMMGQIVSADSAKYYNGKIVTVKGTVMSTFKTTGDKKSLVLNFNKPFPDQSFQVIIYEEDFPKFKYPFPDNLKDKIVYVKGKVRMVKGKPEIMVNAPDQIFF